MKKRLKVLPLLLAALLGCLYWLVPTAAQAIPRGEVLEIAPGLVFSNFVLEDGRRVYCLEVEEEEPTGEVKQLGELSSLPGKAGKFHAYSDPVGIRKMNFLIASRGQKVDGKEAAAVQIAVWLIRAEKNGMPEKLQSKINRLQEYEIGREVLARANALLAEAAEKAVAPEEPQPVTGALALVRTPERGEFAYDLTYPAGTSELRLTGGVFEKTGTGVLLKPESSGGTVAVRATAPGEKMQASGSWVVRGKRGYPETLEVWDGYTAAGVAAQRVGFGAGEVVQSDLSGEFAMVSIAVPPPLGDPTARSIAVAKSVVGQTIKDSVIVEPVPGTTPRMWEGAEAVFTAYLLPTVGSPKYDENWEPIVRDEAAGAGSVASMDGPAASAADAPSSSAAEVSTAGADVVRWTKEELAALSAAERCTAQPVFTQGGVAVTDFGVFDSAPVVARSAGVVHWVEKIIANGEVVHEGACGVPSETSTITQPTVVTKATAEVKLGEEMFDTAIVTPPPAGLAEGQYSIVFRAYRGSAKQTGSPAAVCDEHNLLYTSPRLPVPAVAAANTDETDGEKQHQETSKAATEVTSPGVRALAEHGETVWWVETLLANSSAGEIVVAKGECGLPAETTTVRLPELPKTGMGFIDFWFLGWGSAALIAGGVMLVWQRRREM